MKNIKNVKNKITLLLLVCGVLPQLNGCNDDGPTYPIDSVVIVKTPIFNITGVSDDNVPENEVYNSATPSLSGDDGIGAITWSLQGDDASLFTIDAQTGAFNLVAQDFETPVDMDNNNDYKISLVATDSAENFSEITITVTITDEVEIPVAMAKCNNPWDAEGNMFAATNEPDQQTCYRVSGQIIGLISDELSITLNNEEIIQSNTDGNFEFLTPFINSETFSVNFAAISASQQCELINEQGTVADANIDDLIVQCAPIANTCDNTSQTSTGDKDLSGNNIAGIESLVETIECGEEAWRVAANTRIDASRKSNSQISVVDKNGDPISNVKVNFTLNKHDFNFGGIAQARMWHGDTAVDAQLYKQIFLDFDFTKTGFQNALKYKLRNGHEAYVPDMLDWFKSYAIPVRGHTLIWPGWDNMEATISTADAASMGITAGAPQDLSAAELKIYVDSIIASWAAKWDVVEWDVANELRGKHEVQDVLGYQEEANWYKLAKANVLNSSATLFLNENRIISDDSSEVISDKMITFKTNAQAILALGGPIEALGFQSRFGKMTGAETIYQRLQYFDDLNLPISATEFEIKNDLITEELDRAIMTERVMSVYFSKENVNDILAWTLFEHEGSTSDRHLVATDGTPNLRGKTWLYLVKKHWHTDVNTWLDRDGKANLTGYKGTYTVTVSFDNFPDQVIELALLDNENITVQLPHYINGSDSSIPAVFTITGLSANDVLENEVYTSDIPSLSGDDSIGAITWSLQGDDDSLFTINAQTGVFSLVAQDYENPVDADNNNDYEIILVVTDTANNIAEVDITVTITDVDEVQAYSPPEISGDNGAISSSINANGLIFLRSPLPTETNLPKGQVTVEGTPWAQLDWGTAVTYCESIDARLPTKVELEDSLLPLVNDGSFNGTHHWPVSKTYWSITEIEANKHNVMKTSVSPAVMSGLKDTNKQYVSCVL